MSTEPRSPNGGGLGIGGGGLRWYRGRGAQRGRIGGGGPAADNNPGLQLDWETDMLQ